MTIVLCSKGYPGNYKKNKNIKNLDKLNYQKMILFIMLEQIENNKFYLMVEEF